MTFGLNQNGQEIFFVRNEDLIGIIHLIFWAYKCYNAQMCKIRNKMNCDLIYLNSSFVWIHNELNEQARSIAFEWERWGGGWGGDSSKISWQAKWKKNSKIVRILIREGRRLVYLLLSISLFSIQIFVCKLKKDLRKKVRRAGPLHLRPWIYVPDEIVNTEEK